MNLNKILYKKTIEEVSKNFNLLKSSDVHLQIENALKLPLIAILGFKLYLYIILDPIFLG